MKPNIGTLDWLFRFWLFIVFVSLGIKFSPWWYLLAVWEVFVLSTRWCFVYDFFNFSTKQ